MYTTDNLIRLSPHMICHIISLHSFHDMFINQYLKEFILRKIKELIKLTSLKKEEYGVNFSVIKKQNGKMKLQMK